MTNSFAKGKPAVSPRVKINTSILVILCIIGGLFFLGKTGFSILSGLRAYVGGEGLWAKGEKEAAYQLTQYIHTGEETRYRSFLDSLKVPLGDSVARIELEKTSPVYDVAFQGFIDGGNHPDDIPTMISIYKNFKNIQYIRNAIAQWEIGDGIIKELLECGEEIHHHISSNTMTGEQAIRSLATIDALQKRLNEAEKRFSYNMSEAARWTTNLLFVIMFVFSVVGGVVCFIMLRLISGVISDLNDKNIQLGIQADRQREIRKELKENEERLKETQQIARLGSWELDVAADRIWWSDETYRIFGFPKSVELGFEKFLSAIHPEDRQNVNESIRRAIRKCAPLDLDYRIVSPDGDIRHLHEKSSTILDESRGEAVKRMGSVQDITERKKAEEIIREKDRRYREVVEGTGDLITRVDKDGRFTYVNHVGEEILGFSPDELLGRSAFEFIHPEDLEATQQWFEQCLQAKASVASFANRQVNGRTGGTSHCLWTSNFVYDDKGDLLGVNGIAHNITEHKKLEKELIKSQKLEATAILAGGIAHDFNNLLTIVAGHIELALMGLGMDHDNAEDLNQALMAGRRAQRLTKKFITFSAGGAPTKRLASVKDLLMESISSTFSEENRSVEHSLAEDLWLAEIDPGQMSQVFRNVLLNAGESMEEEGVIRVSAENVPSIMNENIVSETIEEGKYIKIVISDQGKGIPDHIMDNIYDPYFSTKERWANKGMGLGLTVALSIVKQHDGHMVVISKESIGTSVRIYLPAA